MATLYQHLGVTPDASPQEIRQAYLRMARRHHPDVHGGADQAVLDEARRRMVLLNEAWAVLGDPDRRRDYDTSLRETAAAADHGGRATRPGEAPNPPWFEPDEVAAADLEEDLPDTGRRSPGDLLVFVPVGLVLVAVGLFAFSVMSESPGMFGVALALVPVALVSFVAMPLVAMLRGSRPRD